MLLSRTSPPGWLVASLQRVEGLGVKRRASRGFLSLVVNGSPIRFDVLHVPVVSHERAMALLREHRARAHKYRVLVATRQLSQPTRELFRKDGVSWAEQLTGVCRLVGPGILVDVKAEDRSQRREGPPVRARLRDRSGLIGETLLLWGPSRKIQVSRLAVTAGVSAPLASRILKRLTSLKVLEAHGAGPYRYWTLTEPGGLLDLWATEEQQQPMRTTSLYVWTRSPSDLLGKISSLDRISSHWAIGGVAAANLYAPTLTTRPELAIWVDARLPAEQIAKALNGEIVDKGPNLQLWQSEGNLALRHANPWKPEGRTAVEGGKLRIVSPPRAYVEAMKEGRRSSDVAQNLRERILAYGS